LPARVQIEVPDPSEKATLLRELDHVFSDRPGQWFVSVFEPPPEEQNHHQPPKRIVEALIPGYQPTVDGPRILAGADYPTIAGRCPTGFGRFVQFLEALVP
jgi:hypothetical protein